MAHRPKVYREDPLLGQDVPIPKRRNMARKDIRFAGSKFGLWLRDVSGNGCTTFRQPGCNDQKQKPEGVKGRHIYPPSFAFGLKADKTNATVFSKGSGK
jgi:hypothetical protein